MSDLALLLSALGLVLLLWFVRLWQRRLASDVMVPPPVCAAVEPGVPPVQGDGEQPSDQIDVHTVEPLTEAQVYLSFGYTQRAADTLRACVERDGAVNQEVLEILCRLYLELGELDGYCDILPLRQLTPAALEMAVRAGLALDRNHLGLRVLADEALQMGPEAFTPVDIPANDKAGRMSSPVPAAAVATTAVQADAVPADVCLIDGAGAVLRSLEPDETRVICLFVPAQRRVRLLLAANDSDHALPALREALRETPGKPSLLIDLLQVHYQHRNIDAYALALWQLFVAMGEAGASLREKLLHHGLALGYHPAFAELAQADSRMVLEAIGQRYGFVRSRPLAKAKLWLVEKMADASEPMAASVLEEADAYLTFGQLEAALELLERSIASTPAQLELYPPLLALYEKMEDLPGLLALQHTLLHGTQALPDEGAVMINTLIRRLQRPAEVA
ncbi:hypothetical protein EHS17_11950 [Rhodobacteraceae bacterium CH30]|nr:hypothetical protein EHS17_11950 [Rhodobacteraceae bacterium CH30]